MTRTEALREICSQYPWIKPAKKLKEAEFDLMVAFADDNEHLPHLEFEYAVNRMFLDKDRTATPNWCVIMEFLISANTRATARNKQPMKEPA